MTLGFWQRVLLGLVLLMIVGLIPELILLEHYEEWQQWVPLALLGAGLVSTLLLWFAPRRATVALFRAVMVLCVVSAAAGLYFHYQANLEFVLERHHQDAGRRAHAGSGQKGEAGDADDDPAVMDFGKVRHEIPGSLVDQERGAGNRDAPPAAMRYSGRRFGASRFGIAEAARRRRRHFGMGTSPTSFGTL